MSEDKLLNSEYQFNMEHGDVHTVASFKRWLQEPGILVIKQSYLWTSLKDHRHGKSMHFGSTCQLIIEIGCTHIYCSPLVNIGAKNECKQGQCKLLRQQHVLLPG